MREELDNKLVEVINSVTDAKDFIVSQTPDVIQQLLLWYAVSSAAWMILSFILIGLYVWFFRTSIKYDADNNLKRGWLRERDGGIDTDAAPIMMFISAVWLVTVFLTFNSDWIKILIAPKLFLVEYVSAIVK